MFPEKKMCNLEGFLTFVRLKTLVSAPQKRCNLKGFQTLIWLKSLRPMKDPRPPPIFLFSVLTQLACLMQSDGSPTLRLPRFLLLTFSVVKLLRINVCDNGSYYYKENAKRRKTSALICFL